MREKSERGNERENEPYTVGQILIRRAQGIQDEVDELLSDAEEYCSKLVDVPDVLSDFVQFVGEMITVRDTVDKFLFQGGNSNHEE